MANTTTVDTNYKVPYELDKSNHRWVLAEGSSFLGDDYSVHQAATLTNDTLIVNGSVSCGSLHGIGIYFEGTSWKIIIGETGSVLGGFGIYALGDDTFIQNDGIVSATEPSMAIYMEGTSAHAINNGEVVGATGIRMSSKGGLIENNGAIHATLIGIETNGDGTTVNLGENSMIAASDKGIYVHTDTGEKTTITNDGLIAAKDATAIGGIDGNEIVINHGSIRGDISLGAGNDVFNNLDGKYSGTIYGGAGNDQFVIRSAMTHITELPGEGIDTVKAMPSYHLGDALDNLVLLGKADLNGTGNELDNHITGNARANVLKGGAGTDYLDGGKGADTLTGGLDADRFIFRAGNGIDTVTDFTKGFDYIDVDHVKGYGTFADLSAHITQHGANTWIEFDHGQRLVLDHVTAATLTADDFEFNI